MVNDKTAELDRTFAALADPTRRAIVQRLKQGTATVGELAEPFDMSLPAVSKHVRVLEDSGLLVRQKEGRYHNCQLNAGPLQEAAGWLAAYEQFWGGQLDALAGFLERPNEEETP